MFITKVGKRNLIIIIVSLLLSAIALVWAYAKIKSLPKYDYSIDDWKSEFAVYNNGFSVNDVVKNSGKTKEFLWGPYKPLQKGSYTANISYSSEMDQSCFATSAGEQAALFQSSKGQLSARLHETAYQFEVTDDVDEFQLVFYYNGIGEFTINSISIVANNSQLKRLAVEFIALVLLIDGALVFIQKDNNEKKLILALVGITTLVSLPMFIHGIHDGHDLGVHYLRIEAIVQALRSGQFPARISSITLYGLGYPFSIYYNDLYLYFPAVLRLLGFSIDAAYKIYAAAFNLITVMLSYFSFKNIFKNRKIACILTLLYTASAYRLLNIFIRGAVGEYSAQAFLPLIALSLYRIYNQPVKNIRDIFRNALLLAAAMTMIIGAHVLTTIMVCFIMLLVFLYFFRKSFQKETLFTFILAVVFSLLLNAYFLVPFIDYYFNVPTLIRSFVSNELTMIQGFGVYFSQFFAFFQNVHGSIDVQVGDRMQMTPGLPLMCAFVIGCYFKFVKKGQKYFNFLLSFSFLTLWLASDLFPWDWLILHFSPWRIMIQIQFPYRFLGIAILFLTLLAGCILKNKEISYLQPAAVCSAVVMSLWFMSSLFNGSEIIYIYDTSSLYPTYTGLEYLLEGSSREKITTGVYTENMAAAEVMFRNSNTLRLYCKTGDVKGKHLVDAPVYAYKGYHVIDTNGNEYAYFPGNENRINFELPDGFDGEVTIVFRDPAYWRVALWTSIITAAVIGSWALLSRKKQVLTLL